MVSGRSSSGAGCWRSGSSKSSSYSSDGSLWSPFAAWRTVPCVGCFLGVAGPDGGSGGSSPLPCTELTYDAACSFCLWLNECAPELEEPSERVVPLFSQVSGGPDTCTGFGCVLPTVSACLTVPKSHRSS